jgi:hypothetical protein
VRALCFRALASGSELPSARDRLQAGFAVVCFSASASVTGLLPSQERRRMGLSSHLGRVAIQVSPRRRSCAGRSPVSPVRVLCFRALAFRIELLSACDRLRAGFAVVCYVSGASVTWLLPSQERRRIGFCSHFGPVAGQECISRRSCEGRSPVPPVSVFCFRALAPRSELPSARDRLRAGFCCPALCLLRLGYWAPAFAGATKDRVLQSLRAGCRTRMHQSSLLRRQEPSTPGERFLLQGTCAQKRAAERS